MASNASFDVSTGADLQEVDNAVNQALKEIAQRYDFKGTHCTIEFDRPKAEIRLAADDEFRMDALVDVLQTRMIKRGVPVKNLEVGELDRRPPVSSVRRTVKLTQGIPQDVAKKIIKAIKDGGFKKVQATHPGRRDAGHQPVARRAAGGHRLPPGPGFRHRAQVWQLPRLSPRRPAAGAVDGGVVTAAAAVAVAACRELHAPRRHRADPAPRRWPSPSRRPERRAEQPDEPMIRVGLVVGARPRHRRGRGGPQRQRSRPARAWRRFPRARSGG